MEGSGAADAGSAPRAAVVASARINRNFLNMVGVLLKSIYRGNGGARVQYKRLCGRKGSTTLQKLVASMNTTAVAITAVAAQPKNRCRALMVCWPMSAWDWPIHIRVAMMGTEMTPLMMALHTSALEPIRE